MSQLIDQQKINQQLYLLIAEVHTSRSFKLLQILKLYPKLILNSTTLCVFQPNN